MQPAAGELRWCWRKVQGLPEPAEAPGYGEEEFTPWHIGTVM
jgi:hypothetical protein